jgi:predicted NAD-dependent protein-ADP-ribosyltransferase YbiA (DUF1768 family)
MSQVDIRKYAKYLPESFISATPINLAATDNKVAEYSNFEPNVIVVQGLSFNSVDGLVFHMDVDGFTDVVKLDNLAAVRGLDYEENIKVPSVVRTVMRITSSTTVSNYQWRHRVTVFKPTVAMKLQLGMKLTGDEPELAEKYGLVQALKVSTPEPFNLYSGIEEWRTVATKLTSSGTILRLPVPKGKKVILTGISATRPSSAAAAYLNVDRDGTESVQYLDLYCLPNLSYEVPLRIVALDKLEVSLDAKTSGSYYVRISYGIGSLTLREKVMWTPSDLTPDERKEAEEKDLYDKVAAGVS